MSIYPAAPRLPCTFSRLNHIGASRRPLELITNRKISMKHQKFFVPALLILVLGLLHSPVWAEDWKFFHETQNGNVSFDVASVSRSQHLVKIRKRVEFKTPHKSIISSPGYEYIASVSLEEYDCKNHTAKTVEAINILKDGSKKQAEYLMSDGMPIIGPYMEKELSFACDPKTALKP